MSEDVEVTSYSGRLSSQIISIGDISYKLENIPDEMILIGDVMDEETEAHLINLIDTKQDAQLRDILNCMAKEFETNIKFKLNEKRYNYLKAGEGMMWENEDKRQYNPVVVVVNFGCDVMMSFQKPSKTYNVMLPRRSMFLFSDPKYEYKRGIAKRLNDVYEYKTYERQKRYSLVFKSRK